ncbi:MAG: sodium:proton antiporter [Acidobacteriota bacterium]
MSTHMTAEMPEAIRQSSPPRLSALRWLAIAGGCLLVGLLIFMSLNHHGAPHEVPHEPPPWWGLGILPFVGILGCIAILPLLPATHHWWESNHHRLGVSLTLSAITLGYYVLARGIESIPTVLEHAVVVEYIPFIVLLFSLYVISGGISLQGDLPAHPSTNVAFLAVGAGIASLIGTTGASMLLIRPLLQTNSQRRHITHTVIFFIFLVSNVGGCLLPIGDPPLFLGYLFGVPFFWTLGLWAPWLSCCVVLLVIYFIWDTIAYKKEDISSIQRDELQRQPLRLRGAINLLWLLGVVLSVAFVVPGEKFPVLGFEVFPFMRELLMLGFVALSLWKTPKGTREQNQFNYTAILEVAALFIGIFIAMQVPVEVLTTSGETLAHYINQPWHFFWSTGTLSAFLDNAPTYVVCFELSRVLPDAGPSEVVSLAGGGTIPASLLIGVSLGAVFMGAMTYIGNAPNFMVKAIAEQAGIKMPSFFGYLFRYSIPILIPVFVVVTLIFLRS